MLVRLYIKNFALIEEVEIEFGAGLNVITGETGAGKSILLGALNSILGGSVNADLVRSGADKCIVEGLFEFASGDPVEGRLEAVGAELDDGQLIVRRDIGAGGRSRAYVNGLGTSLKALKEIGSVLVDLHGQHEHQSLLNVNLHATFLDDFGALGKGRQQVRQAYRQQRQTQNALERLLTERQQLVREEEMRQFQLQEIRTLDPQVGEEERLEGELRVLGNRETLVALASQLYERLYQAEGSVVEQLGQDRRNMANLVEGDPGLNELGEAFEGLIYGVEDLASSLRAYAQNTDRDPGRLDQLNERLDGLRRLKKKYGGTLEDVAEFGRHLAQQESRAEDLDQEIAQRQAELADQRGAFAHACLRLSAQRQRQGQRLARAVDKGLKGLGMAQAHLTVALVPAEEEEGLVERDGKRWRAGEEGMEKVEFYIAANAGEGPRPLARIASGGEISRIMLALKEVIAENDTVATLVFDEIDVGISGRIAAAVGKKLEGLAQSHQTIVITHLPQIASMAHRHFSVRKRLVRGRTVTEVVALEEAERTEEIAHLLAGETVSDTARQHAQEMLE
ncbi:MAG: DNA repair protein RecN [Candidatus Latescibacteria bacterium]|nr:DNA repair protein RecN [Candidatus Latescibacterota bacterium]